MNEKHSGVHDRPPVAIWFFIGVLLLIYGVIILVTAIAQWKSPPPTVLSQYHSTFWAGVVLTILGLTYTLVYRPRHH